ncbi:MAG: shikimate kinase [Acidimicrobiales bacterium]
MSDVDPDRPHIVILGLMGVGKSTVAEALAERLGRPVADSDRDIERLTGVTGRTYAEASGVPALHRLEAAVLLGALARPEPTVVSAAASTVEDPQVRQLLGRRATVVRLVADIELTIDRQRAGGHRRPMDPEELIDLAARREPMFSAVEDLRVDANRRPVEIVADIGRFLGPPMGR